MRRLLVNRALGVVVLPALLGACTGQVDIEGEASSVDGGSPTVLDSGEIGPADAGSRVSDDAGSTVGADSGRIVAFGCPASLPSGWLLCDDFEADDVACFAGADEDPCDAFHSVRGVDLSTAEMHSGAKSMRLVFSYNEQEKGAQFKLPPGQNHFFTRYYDYYADDFDFAAGMKVHRIFGKDASTLLNTYDTIAVLWGESIPHDSGNFCGTNDINLWNFGANGDWGESYFNPDPPVQRGEWHCWEYEFKVNTPGVANGEFRVWLDGEMQAERRSLNMSSRPTDFNAVLFGGWYSNGAAGRNPCVHPEMPSARYIDDVAVATERIGCL